MNKLDLLKDLIEDKKFQSDKEDFKYIGTGNPEAKILIIGKECSIHDNAEDQKKREITNNFEFWKNFVSGAKDKNQNGYSPLYPYKGQKLLIRNSRTGDNGGTSLTWCKYQKLVNLIFDIPGNI